jgi:hypothetical protein
MNVGYLAWSKTRIYLLFLCIAAGVMTASGVPIQLAHLWRISRAPVAALGTVTGLDCPDHGRVKYTFALNGATIRGASRIVEGAPCRTLRLGDRVNVSYERGDPANNHAFASTDDSESREAREFWTGAIFMGVFVALGPLFLVFVARLLLRLRLRLGV